MHLPGDISVAHSHFDITHPHADLDFAHTDADGDQRQPHAQRAF